MDALAVPQGCAQPDVACELISVSEPLQVERIGPTEQAVGEFEKHATRLRP